MTEENPKTWSEVRAALEAAMQEARDYIAALGLEMTALETKKVGLQESIAQLSKEEDAAGKRKRTRVLESEAEPIEPFRVSDKKLITSITQIETALDAAGNELALDVPPGAPVYQFRDYGSDWRSRALSEADIVSIAARVKQGQNINTIARGYSPA